MMLYFTFLHFAQLSLHEWEEHIEIILTVGYMTTKKMRKKLYYGKKLKKNPNIFNSKKFILKGKSNIL